MLAERWPLGLPFEQLAVESGEMLRAASGTSSGTSVLQSRLKERVHPPRGEANDVSLRAQSAMSATDAQVLANGMLQCYALDMLELRVKPPPMTLALSTRPVASALARLQAQRGLPLTNLRHGRVILDDFSLAC